MMYHEPIDMMMRMISVPRDTKSPCFHRASRPYGFSTTSFCVVASCPAPGGGAGVAGFGASAVAGAGVAPVAPWAWAAAGARHAADAKRTNAASNAGSRWMGFIVGFLPERTDRTDASP